MKQKLTPPGSYNSSVSHSLKPPGAQQYQHKQLVPPGSANSLNIKSKTKVPISQAAYERLKQHPQHRRMGPTTSALVRPAPPCSRPPPGAALRVMPPKKRVKLDDDTDSDKDSVKSEESKSEKDSLPSEANSLPVKPVVKPMIANKVSHIHYCNEGEIFSMQTEGIPNFPNLLTRK